MYITAKLNFKQLELNHRISENHSKMIHFQT